MKFKYIPLLFLTTSLIGGCSKSFLDTKPSSSIDAGSAFSSQERVTAAMTGLYDIITRSAYNTHIALTTDVRGGDQLVVSTGNYSRFTTEYQVLQSPTAGYGGGFWSNALALIANANQAIAQIPGSPLSDAQKTGYVAEARALRAWANYGLIRLFAQPYVINPDDIGLPKLDRPLGPDDKTPARVSIKEIYNFILDDLNFAKTNLPTTKTDIYRVTVNSINGLLARVYLEIGQWQNAADAAKLARTGFVLPDGTALLKGFVDPTSEWIWALNYRSDDNTGYLQIASFEEPYNIGYSTFRATPEFFNLFAANDIRRQQFFLNTAKLNGTDPNGDALKRDAPATDNDGYLMNKFWFRSTWDLNVPLMRSAEMYLIEAEANAELGNNGVAQQALFQVQKRAITGAVISVNTGDALKTEIRDERRKELYGEGFRFFDILRKKETLTRTAPSHWAPIVLKPGDYRNIYPIPQSEREASGMQQNAGYPQ